MKTFYQLCAAGNPRKGYDHEVMVSRKIYPTEESVDETARASFKAQVFAPEKPGLKDDKDFILRVIPLELEETRCPHLHAIETDPGVWFCPQCCEQVEQGGLHAGTLAHGKTAAP